MNAESDTFCNPDEIIENLRIPHSIEWKTRLDDSRFGQCSLCHCWVGLRLSTEVYRGQVKTKARKVRATLTNAPRTPSCWYAEGDVCACSCGGKHHGIGHNPEAK
jgi:hypothetical protein